MSGLGPNPDFLLGGCTSASAECRHWSGRAVRSSSCAILPGPAPAMTTKRERPGARPQGEPTPARLPATPSEGGAATSKLVPMPSAEISSASMR